MIKTLMTSVMALTVLIGAGIVAVQPAEARGGRAAAGIAAGIIGLGLLGAYAHARNRDRHYYDEPACYRGPRECYRVGGRCFYNRYGERVCRHGEVRCHRPTICR